MYLTAEQVFCSLQRLSSRNQTGKDHLERTSALMYFLSFDAVCKLTACEQIDLDPDKIDGRNNRKAVELEFTKLVLINNDKGKITQIIKLGEIEISNKSPSMRISSNFLSVPLKKATGFIEPYSYPKRPPTPLMNLGKVASGVKWGIEYHPNWQINLPKLLSVITQPTPFTDLAIVIFRDTLFKDEQQNHILSLSTAINDRYTSKLSKFWSDSIINEQLFVRHIKSPFHKEHNPFGKHLIVNPQINRMSLNKELLIARVNYLEEILLANNINFKKLSDS